MTLVQQPYFTLKSSWRPTPLKDLPRWEDKRIGLDIETYDPELTTLGPGVRRGARIVGVSFCLNSQRKPYYIPIAHDGGGNVDPFLAVLYLREQAVAFRGEIVGANLQYDLDFLEEIGVKFHSSVRFRDVQLADPLINELHMSYTLDAIAKRWGLPLKDTSHIEEAARTWGLANWKKEMWKLPAHHVGDYAEYDALLPLLILDKQELELWVQDLERVWDLETDVLPVSLAMRRRGVLIDQGALTKIGDWTMDVEIEELEKVQTWTGVVIPFGDTNKSSLLARALQEIGLVAPLTPKTRKPSVSAGFLVAHDHPVTRALLRAKQFAKLRTTFCAQVWKHLVKGRVHCTFNQLKTAKPGQEESAGAAFGRFSSTNFNIQNQPIRHKEYGKLWRSIYIPNPGTQWTTCDFSSQEPRLAVHFAALMEYPGAAKTAKSYWDHPDTDPHSATAAMMFPKQWGRLGDYYTMGPEAGGQKYQDAAVLRSTAKTLFLGLCYGMGGGKLCRQIGLPAEPKSFKSWRTGETVNYLAPGPEGQKILDQFKARVPFIPMLAKEAEKRAGTRGYVLTHSGRRCRFRQYKGEYIELHKALNRVIQGSAGDQMKTALRDLHGAGIPIQMTVHDEVDWSCNSEEEMRFVGNMMRDSIELKVPSKVDIEYGPSWGKLNKKVTA